jgi:hypothetical protein
VFTFRAILDGRGLVVPEYPNGNFLGPTVLDHMQPSMEAYKQEIFGPVLQVCLCKWCFLRMRDHGCVRCRLCDAARSTRRSR